MQYLQNKYHTWYNCLIQKAQSRCSSTDSRKIASAKLGGYVEQHHIIPRSLGGKNDKANLVWLTCREHYIAHLLLVKFTRDQAKIKMTIAAYYLSQDPKKKGIRVSSRLREHLAKAKIESQLGSKRSNETRARISAKAKLRGPWSVEQRMKHSEMRKGQRNPMFGKSHSEQERKSISLRMSGDRNPNYGKKNSEEYKQKMSQKLSGENNPRYGIKLTDEFKSRISASLIGKTVGTIIINDGIKAKRIRPDEFEYYCSLGYSKGRPTKKSN